MATHWDDIYRKFEQGGEAWATLSEDIHPTFIAYVEHAHFPLKSAFDIGCGTGKYLHFLHERGFAVAGIDNSETALKMTKSAVPDAQVINADMYSYDIPIDRYDLILSVSTIQHGTKPQVASAIQKIHTALVKGGHCFITLPEWDHMLKKDISKTHETLAPGVLAPLSGPEKGLAHSFYTENELKDFFKDFKNLQMALDEYTRWVITGEK